jgi:hypothetical protein
MVLNRIKRIGRNESCPCGSGMKYKKCCLKERQSMSATQQQNGRIQLAPEEQRAVAPLAVFTVVVGQDLNVNVQCQGNVSHPIINLALETAKQLLAAQIMAKQKEAGGIVVAPPGLKI